MNKHQNLTDPASCLSKAADDEPLFVLRAKDPLAPTIVRMWASLATSTGAYDRLKQFDAMRLSYSMEDWRQKQEHQRSLKVVSSDDDLKDPHPRDEPPHRTPGRPALRGPTRLRAAILEPAGWRHEVGLARAGGAGPVRLFHCLAT